LVTAIRLFKHPLRQVLFAAVAVTINNKSRDSSSRGRCVLTALAELAKLRGVTLDGVMNRLGIQLPLG